MSFLKKLMEDQEKDVQRGKIRPYDEAEKDIPPAFRGQGRKPEEFARNISGGESNTSADQFVEMLQGLPDADPQPARCVRCADEIVPGVIWPHAPQDDRHYELAYVRSCRCSRLSDRDSALLLARELGVRPGDVIPDECGVYLFDFSFAEAWRINLLVRAIRGQMDLQLAIEMLEQE